VEDNINCFDRKVGWRYISGTFLESGSSMYFRMEAKTMRRAILVSLVLAMGVCVVGCKKKEEPSGMRPEAKEKGKMGSIAKQSFGQTQDGMEVEMYTLTNANGIRAKISTYGGTLVSLELPDRDGNMSDVALGFDTFDGYLTSHPYFGVTVGRYANRIGGAKFTLEGKEYKLAANDGANHLHGGVRGLDKVLWNTSEVEAENGVGLRLAYISMAGEENYPGTLACIVTYTLTNNDELRIDYEAVTDKATVVNLTNHTYWNLAGQGNGDILSHELMIDADRYTPVDEGLIPTGEIRSVKGPMDFTKPMAIGSRIDQVPGGYDHNYVLNSGGGELALCAKVYEPSSGRVMEILTTEPGVQLYSGNFLDGSITGKGGKVYEKHYGFCLETQHFPDSPNKPEFPSVVLRPGEEYSTTTVHKFYTK